MTYDEWLATLLPFEAKALTNREIFQAGAAFRDAYIERLETGLLQVRKALCGDIHNTDDLLDLIASRDAEVAELKAELETERCLSFRNQVADIESERDQLREQVKMLRDVVNDALSGMGGGYAIWSPRAQEALAATESRSTK